MIVPLDRRSRSAISPIAEARSLARACSINAEAPTRIRDDAHSTAGEILGRSGVFCR
jgi:hypothetical protein